MNQEDYNKIMLYWTGELPSGELETFEAELANSEEMQDELALLQEIDRCPEAFPVTEPSQDLVTAAMHQARQQPEVITFPSKPWWQVAAAVAVIAFGATVWFSSYRTTPTPLVQQVQEETVPDDLLAWNDEGISALRKQLRDDITLPSVNERERDGRRDKLRKNLRRIKERYNLYDA